MSNGNIAILIPCYNEELTIKKVIMDWKKELPEAMVYVYDNNSTDRTAAIAAECGAVVRKEPMQGKGNVIRRMFREIHADCYLMVDGDDTYPADCAKAMVSEVLDHQADMVIGDRLSSTYFTENKRRFHNFGNRLVRGVINFLFHSNVKDIMTGCRAFSYQFVKTFAVMSGNFEIETEMTLHALDKRMLIREIPIQYRDRQEGSQSKLKTITDGRKVLFTILSLFRDYRPFPFFSILSLLFFLMGGIGLLPVLVEYLRTGFVPRFPTLIVCGFLILAAIICFFHGILLSSIARQEKRLFEWYLLHLSLVFFKR